jgi:hypothetical protein
MFGRGQPQGEGDKSIPDGGSASQRRSPAEGVEIVANQPVAHGAPVTRNALHDQSANKIIPAQSLPAALADWASGAGNQVTVPTGPNRSAIRVATHKWHKTAAQLPFGCAL